MLLQGLHLLLQRADFGFGGLQVFLHAGLLRLNLAEHFLQLGDVLAGGVQLLLSLRALVGKGRTEQARQGEGKECTKHEKGVPGERTT